MRETSTKHVPKSDIEIVQSILSVRWESFGFDQHDRDDRAPDLRLEPAGGIGQLGIALKVLSSVNGNGKRGGGRWCDFRAERKQRAHPRTGVETSDGK